jgi:hypothetical protein
VSILFTALIAQSRSPLKIAVTKSIRFVITLIAPSKLSTNIAIAILTASQITPKTTFTFSPCSSQNLFTASTKGQNVSDTQSLKAQKLSFIDSIIVLPHSPAS